MPKVKTQVTTEKLICDNCGKESEKKKEWIILQGKRRNDLFLLEREKTRKYETFQIRDKKEVCFCSSRCARTQLIQDLDLFLADNI